MPGLQENGQFIGEQRYRQMLEMQNPPLTPGDFEEQIRRGVTLQKLQAALTDWITVDDKELEDEFKRRNEKVKLAVVSFPADKFREGLEATDAELARLLRGAQERPEDPREAQSEVCARRYAGDSRPHADLAAGHPAAYEDNQQQYSTPEQVRASHILFKTEGKDDAAVKKQAEDLLAKVKAGANFAQLATKYSEDDVEQSQGRRSRLLPQGPDGAGVRQGGVLDEAGRDQRPGEDAVRLPHHQGHR